MYGKCLIYDLVGRICDEIDLGLLRISLWLIFRCHFNFKLEGIKTVNRFRGIQGDHYREYYSTTLAHY